MLLKSFLMSSRRFTVRLENAHFFARHGVLPQEKIVGNEFRVDIGVSFDAPAAFSDADIETTVSYAHLYDIAREVMETPFQLLETVAAEIADRIADRFGTVDEIKVKINKLRPPISGFDGSASVEYCWER